MHTSIFMLIQWHCCHTYYLYKLLFAENNYFAGRLSQQMSRGAFEAFERRRSTILAERRTQTQKYDIYDDANDLRPSNDPIFKQPSQSNSDQFQYNNPGFKQDENI